MDTQVFYEATPNPQSMKFNFTLDIANESVFFDDPQKVSRSPLAQKLFGFPWMKAVYIGQNFVTITKQEWVDWTVLAEPLSDLLAEHVERKEPILTDALETTEIPTASDYDENDSEIVRKIKTVLNNEIRPAVAMDGGDITFGKYENQRLYIHMQGACSGCPSSTMTLKEGIEVRMKELIPDLIEVISI